MITGAVDYESLIAEPNRFASLADYDIRVTECTHIFASSTSKDISGANVDGLKVKDLIIPGLSSDQLTRYALQHNYAASAWAVIMQMGAVLFPDELNGADIHRLENILTMEEGLHSLFDKLGLWLEATVCLNLLLRCYHRSRQTYKNVPDQYTLHAAHPGILNHLPEVVTFTTSTNLPLPDPKYLAIHAACAKVAHLSAAAEYIDTVHRDVASTLVLARDGSSARVLEAALSRISIGA